MSRTKRGVLAVVFFAVSICSWFSLAGVLRCFSGSSGLGLDSRVHVVSTAYVYSLLKCITVNEVGVPSRRLLLGWVWLSTSRVLSSVLVKLVLVASVDASYSALAWIIIISSTFHACLSVGFLWLGLPLTRVLVLKSGGVGSGWGGVAFHTWPLAL